MDTIKEAIIRLVDEFGIEVLCDARRTKAILSDYIPTSKDEIRLIFIAIEAGVGKDLVERNKTNNGRIVETDLKAAVSLLMNEATMDQANAEKAITYLGYAFGVKNDKQTEGSTAIKTIKNSVTTRNREVFHGFRNVESRPHDIFKEIDLIDQELNAFTSKYSSAKKGITQASSSGNQVVSNSSTRIMWLVLGLFILSLVVAPFIMFVVSVAQGNVEKTDDSWRYVYLISTMGLPVLPLLISRIVCIKRTDMLTKTFKFISTVCRFLKYDTLLVIAAIIMENKADEKTVRNICMTIRRAYLWILNCFRTVLHFGGTDEWLQALADKMGISLYYFNDIVRLVAMFLVYLVLIKVLRSRKNSI